jgi:hypothetical protein
MINIGDRFKTTYGVNNWNRTLFFEVIDKRGKGWYKIINYKIIDNPKSRIDNINLNNIYITRYCPINDTLYIKTNYLFGEKNKDIIYLNRI